MIDNEQLPKRGVCSLQCLSQPCGFWSSHTHTHTHTHSSIVTRCGSESLGSSSLLPFTWSVSSHRGETGMWRGASAAMAERGHFPSTMRLFYTVTVWVTLIHGTGGIPWTEEKVNTFRGSAHILWPSSHNVIFRHSENWNLQPHSDKAKLMWAVINWLSLAHLLFFYTFKTYEPNILIRCLCLWLFEIAWKIITFSSVHVVFKMEITCTWPVQRERRLSSQIQLAHLPTCIYIHSWYSSTLLCNPLEMHLGMPGHSCSSFMLFFSSPLCLVAMAAQSSLLILQLQVLVFIDLKWTPF